MDGPPGDFIPKAHTSPMADVNEALEWRLYNKNKNKFLASRSSY